MITAYHGISETASPISQYNDRIGANGIAERDVVDTAAVDDIEGSLALCRRQASRKEHQSGFKQRTESPASHRSPLARKPEPLIDMLGCGSGDPFLTLPHIARGDTNSLAYHCK